MTFSSACRALLDALEVPWAQVDEQGRVRAFHPRFPPVPSPEPTTPLRRWFPQVPWPFPGTGPWRWPLDPARTLLVWPEDEGYLAVLHQHGSGLATLPVPAGKAFLNMMVHEMRLPLTPIRGYGELMKQGLLGDLTEKQREVLDILLDSVARLDRLLDRLSLLGKLESGNLLVHYQKVPSAAWLTEKGQKQQPQMQESGLSFDLQVPSHLPPMWTDPSMLERILEVFLENARNYTPQGGRVVLDARWEDGFVEIGVQDSGIGIDPEEQPLVFQPFFRSADERVRSQRGWGLDLFLAYRLARYLGGQVGFSSSPGQGSRFWVRMPVAEDERA